MLIHFARSKSFRSSAAMHFATPSTALGLGRLTSSILNSWSIKSCRRAAVSDATHGG